jgi:hypothetical protein
MEKLGEIELSYILCGDASVLFTLGLVVKNDARASACMVHAFNRLNARKQMY